MCEVCEQQETVGNPAQAAHELLERLANAMGQMTMAGVATDHPDSWEEVQVCVSDLDLLCMEHLEGTVRSDMDEEE